MMKKILIGFTILGVGVLILLGNINVITYSNSLLRKIWPVLLLAFGIGEMIDSKRINVMGIIFTVIGCYFTLYNFDILKVSFFEIVFPVLLILVGLCIIIPRKGNGKRIEVKKSDIVLNSAFGGIENKCIAKNFKKATITTIFGGATLDLRDADMDKECVCEATVIFGGADIFVQDD